MSNVYCAQGNYCPGYQGATCFVASGSRHSSGIEYAKKHKGTFGGLAVTQLILGICLVGIGISLLPICAGVDGCGQPYYDSWYYYYAGVWTKMSTNIWGGALVILFASFGLVQTCSPSTCSIVTNLTLSILGAIFTPALMSLEIIAAIVSWKSAALITLHSIASFILFTLFILFIVSASYAGKARGCCCQGCCCDSGGQEVVSVFQGSQPQVVTLSNGQTLILQGQPQNAAGVSYLPSPPQYNAQPNQVVPVNTATGPGSLGQGIDNQGCVVDAIPAKA